MTALSDYITSKKIQMIAVNNEELHACFRCLGPVCWRRQRGRPRRCPLSAARTSCNSTPRSFLRARRCWRWSTRAKLWANLRSPLQQPRPCSGFRIPCETQTFFQWLTDLNVSSCLAVWTSFDSGIGPKTVQVSMMFGFLFWDQEQKTDLQCSVGNWEIG